MRRVWRLGQTQPGKVVFISYTGPLEERALRLMGCKRKAAQLLYGDSVSSSFFGLLRRVKMAVDWVANVRTQPILGLYQ
ncbi:MAG: hypothetical protein GVY30_10220 [Chloroflexi bacterium]|jgi:hypothetical protein|nr:hypothetical protein [Chloroflexota bacterium]